MNLKIKKLESLIHLTEVAHELMKCDTADFVSHFFAEVGIVATLLGCPARDDPEQIPRDVLELTASLPLQIVLHEELESLFVLGKTLKRGLLSDQNERRELILGVGNDDADERVDIGVVEEKRSGDVVNRSWGCRQCEGFDLRRDHGGLGDGDMLTRKKIRGRHNTSMKLTSSCLPWCRSCPGRSWKGEQSRSSQQFDHAEWGPVPPCSDQRDDCPETSLDAALAARRSVGPAPNRTPQWRGLVGEDQDRSRSSGGPPGQVGSQATRR